MCKYLTHGLDLLHHPGPELLDSDLHTGPAAVGALLHRARLPAHALARVADDVLLESQLPRGPVVHVLQGHRQLVHKVLGPPRPSAAASTTEGVAATEEHVEDVHGVAHAATASHTALLDGLLTALVVQPSLLGVGQDLVGKGDLLELVACIWVLVWMVFECKFSVGFLQLGVVSIGFNTIGIGIPIMIIITTGPCSFV